MKKIISLLLILMLTVTLCGCGKKDVVTSKTCTMTQSNMDMSYKLTATNDEIDKLVLTITPNNSLFGVDSLNVLDDAQKEQVKTAMLKNLGLDSSNYEGLDIDIKIDDNMVVTVTADLKVADKDVLKKIGMDFTGVDMSLKRAVEDMEDAGATCK